VSADRNAGFFRVAVRKRITTVGLLLALDAVAQSFAFSVPGHKVVS
jgi:hypothetical protein